MRWMLILLIVESFLWGGSLNYARADIIGFQFSGSWTKVDPTFTNFAGSIGQPITGSIYYDTTIADVDSKQNRGYYYGTDSKIINLSFTTNKTSVKISKARITIFDYPANNSPPSQFQLWFNLAVKPNQATPAASLPVNTTGSFSLIDTTKKYFTNEELPCTIDPLRSILPGSFALSIAVKPGQFPPEAIAQINSITPLPVPEPESLILLCSGLALVFFYRRFNNRKGRLQKLRA